MRYQHYFSGEMRENYPHRFGAADLAQLARFLDGAPAVMPMRETMDGGPGVALRHDVDHNLEHAVLFAEWEADHGYRSSYYVLHTAWYYADESGLRRGMERLVELGHEVGLHQDAVAEAWRRGHRDSVDGSVMPAGDCRAAADIVSTELDRLRGFGFEIVGTAAHGTPLWASDQITNTFLWSAGYTPQDFGLRYEAYHLHRDALYISDNRGKWTEPLRLDARQTHILAHPCHWDLSSVAVAA